MTLGARSRRRGAAGTGTVLKFAIVVAATWIVLGCSPAGTGPALIEINGATMGTTYTVKVVGLPKGLDVDTLRAAVSEQLDAIERSMSTFRAESEVSRFNASRSTDWMPVSSELVSVLEVAREVSIASKGTFDVTVAPMVEAWGFGPHPPDALPQDDDVQVLRARVNYASLQVRRSPPALRKLTPGLTIDLSAIAKGYAVDRIAEWLDAEDVENYLVEIGGEIRVRGRRDARPWSVAIEQPLPDMRRAQMVLHLNRGAIATSGDYRNVIALPGREISHLIDPRTGYPAENVLASVSVIASTATYADAMATALMVAGNDTGYALALSENVAALFILSKEDGFDTRMTPSFAARLRLGE